MLSCDPLQDLYRSHAIELLHFARRRVGAQEAEDVVQDAYLHFLQRSSAEPIENPRAYLFQVTANAAIDQLRRSKVRTSHQTDDAIELDSLDGAQNYGSGALYIFRLQAALAELPEVQREIFVLNRLEGLTYIEIATQLGLSVRTIDRHMLRVLTFLRQQFSEIGGISAAKPRRG